MLKIWIEVVGTFILVLLTFMVERGGQEFSWGWGWLSCPCPARPILITILPLIALKIMFKICWVTLLICQESRDSCGTEQPWVRERFVSSALASGCVLVELEIAPFHSLRNSPWPLLMLLTGTHSPGSWSGGCPGGSPQTLPWLGPDTFGPLCVLQADRTWLQNCLAVLVKF